MLNPRTVVCNPDLAEGKALVGPLGAVGSVVQQVTDLSELREEVELAWAVAPPNISLLEQQLSRPGSPVAAAVILPAANLPAMVQLLRGPVVRAAVVKEYLDPRLLTYVSAKLLWGDIFGVAKVVPWGVRIHSELITSHDDRMQALSSAARFCRSLGLRSKHREAVELVLDELMMNALYNAPADTEGNPIFSEVAPRERTSLRMERPVILQLASDGTRFIAGVRDTFGSLRPATVLSYLERCLTSSSPMERKTSGAGLGLFFAASNVTELIFNLFPGTATEVICVFDLKAPRQQLMHFGIYEETNVRSLEGTAKGGDGGPGQLVSAPRRSAGRPSRAVSSILAAAVLIFIAAAVLLLWPQLQKPGRGKAVVLAQPPGSVVYLNDVRKGEGDRVLLEDLDVGKPYAISARHPGFEEAREVITVSPDQELTLRLTLKPRKARLKLGSTPPGAAIFIDGISSDLKTPALLDGLVAGRTLAVRLERHGFNTLNFEVKPSATETVSYQGNLAVAPGFALLDLASDPPGARLLVNNADTGLVTPVRGHPLRSGQSYHLSLELPRHVPWELEVKPREGKPIEEQVKLELGGLLTVTANVRGRVLLGKLVDRPLPLVERLLPPGEHRGWIRGENPAVDQPFAVNIVAEKKLNRHLVFGLVTVKGEATRLLWNKQKVKTVALFPGVHELTVVDRETGKTRVEKVKVEADRTVTLGGE